MAGMKKVAKKKVHFKKGVAGKGTGGTARKLINKAMKKGKTNVDIGKTAGRSGNTISQIKRGDITNPPKELLKGLKRAAGGKAKKK